MSQQSLALVLEASQGCQMNCDGCQVIKANGQMPDEATFAKLTGLFADAVSKGVRLAEIELGPTDLMSAVNREEILSHEGLRILARQFHTTTIIASFIHPHREDYARFAEQVHAFTPDNMINVTLPVELKHVFNDKYLQRIQDNLTVFGEHMPNVRHETILSVLFDESLMSGLSVRYSYEELFHRVRDLRITHNTKVDFNFHQGRNGLSTQAESFLRSIRALNYHTLADLRRRTGMIENRHIPWQLLCTPRGGEVIYHQGELYLRPVLNERMFVKDRRFLIQGEWTMNNYLIHTYEGMNRNLLLAQGFKDCRFCDHQVTCADRRIHDLMDLTDTQRCITLLKNNDGIAAYTDESDLQWLSKQP